MKLSGIHVASKKIVIIGASGIIGRAAVRHFAGRHDIEIVAVSRRPETDLPVNARALAIDLAALPSVPIPELATVTHAIFCAFVNASSFDAQRAPNVRLFEGALRLLEHCPRLAHVTLLQGMKAYGSNLGPFKTPAKEDDPRLPGGHYYDDQLDALAAYSACRKLAWTVLRPHVVIGPASRSPQNLAAVIGVYASLKAARGETLDFPGSERAFSTITQATDAGLLAKALEWAGESEDARGEIFNITNGDYFRWRHLWPRIAKLFDLDCGAPTSVKPSDEMTDAEEHWRGLASTYGLAEPNLEGLVSWPFADYIFGVEWDVMADTQKSRRAGFAEFLDSEEMMLHRLSQLRELKIIP